MNWFTRSHQRFLAIMAIVALIQSLALTACGTPTNPTNSGSSSGSTGSPGNTQLNQPSSSHPTGSGVHSTDQQIQSLLRQLDGAQNDVNNSNATSGQDNVQP